MQNPAVPSLYSIPKIKNPIKNNKIQHKTSSSASEEKDSIITKPATATAAAATAAAASREEEEEEEAEEAKAKEAAEKEQEELYASYRRLTIKSLKNLQLLDAEAVTEEERKEAMNGVGEENGKIKKERSQSQQQENRPRLPSDSSSSSSLPRKSSNRKKSSTSSRDGGESNHRGSAILTKTRPRYDGLSSEGNRFITNEEL